MKKVGFEIRNVILCDDIRQEANGKGILIGVYTGDILVGVTPAILPLSLWFQGVGIASAKGIGLRSKFVNTDKKTIGEPFSTQSTDLSVSAGVEFTIALTGIKTALPEAGVLSLQLKYGDNDWQEILRKTVTVVSQPGEESQSAQ